MKASRVAIGQRSSTPHRTWIRSDPVGAPRATPPSERCYAVVLAGRDGVVGEAVLVESVEDVQGSAVCLQPEASGEPGGVHFGTRGRSLVNLPGGEPVFGRGHRGDGVAGDGVKCVVALRSPEQGPGHPGGGCCRDVDGVPGDREVVELLPTNFELPPVVEGQDDWKVGEPLVVFEVPDQPTVDDPVISAAEQLVALVRELVASGRPLRDSA